ncbi:MAG: 1,4-dihydroxy-2-naphthoate polyprenyltransferase [Phycisphaerales bacterium]|nr:1,4-dihydroxy-2-naphthoate polyprenyltransferase [Phycisphaerales bacterium]
MLIWKSESPTSPSLSGSLDNPMNTAVNPASRGLWVWVESARPKTLAASIAPVVIGSALAWQSGPPEGWIVAAVVTLVGAMSVQITCNYANDAFDAMRGADTAVRLGPRRAVASGDVTVRAMCSASAVTALISVASVSFLAARAGWPMVVLGALSVCLAFAYTAGPLPLAYLGLGELFVMLFFGPIAVAGTVFALTQHWDASAIWIGLMPGLLATAILSINNLRDIDEDTKSHKRTLAVRLGRGFARWEYVGSVVAAAAVVVGASVSHSRPVSLAALLPIACLWPTCLRVLGGSQGAELNHALEATGKALLAGGMLFAIGWCLT